VIMNLQILQEVTSDLERYRITWELQLPEIDQISIEPTLL
jgi:hypothetical protein